MELHSIELRYLHYFITLAEELNYRRAAERLHVSTPALSVQIKNLEGMLGVRLFERSTTKVRLTTPGEMLLHKARALMRYAQEAVALTKDAAQEQREHLCVGISDSMNFNFIAETINACRQHMPKVNVTLMGVTNCEEQQQALEENRLHVGFFQEGALHCMKDIGHLLISDLPVCAVMSERHPLTRLQQVTLDDVAPYPLLATQTYVSHEQNMRAVFDAAKTKAPQHIETVSGMNILFATLAIGQSVSLIVKKRILSQFHGLSLRPVKNAQVRVHAVWKTANETPHLRAFIDLLRQTGARYD